MTKIVATLAVGFIALAASTSAEAKSARCFISTHGDFPCKFNMTDSDGSFTIRGGDVEGFSLIMQDDGFAGGFERFGGKNTSLAGTFVRASDDPACWNNPEIEVKVCAW